MNDLPMKSVDDGDPEVKLLLDAGWKHCGNDMWIDPRSTMHNPVRRDTALRFEDILS